MWSSWIFITLLLVMMIALGLPQWFKDLQQVCTRTAAECGTFLQLTPEQAAAWPSLTWYGWYNVLTRGAARLFSFVLGVLIFLRKPDSRVAWVTSIYLIVGIETGIGAALAAAQPAWLLVTQLLAVIGELALVLFTLLFPNDRFQPRWTRWLILPWVIAAVAPTFISLASSLRFAFGILNLLLILVLVGILVYRYRRVFTQVDRQKAKWVIYAFTIGFGLFATGILITLAVYGFDAPVMNPGMWILQDFLIVGVGYFLIPAAIAISILRYQLFDIDIIIRKTLLYAALTGLLATIFFSSVALLQSLISTISNQQSPISIVLSTLAIAALFNPLRVRLQDFIDRRFYRQKYDAEKSLAEFAAIARNEVDLERINAALIRILNDTLQPDNLSLLLTQPSTRPK